MDFPENNFIILLKNYKNLDKCLAVGNLSLFNV
jgi:hypothetical protein